MKKFILRLCLTILLLLALVAGIGWWQADQILDQYLRPQIERLANEKYAVDLTIEKLQWTDAGLALTGLELSHPEGLRLELPTLELSFNLSQLRHRQLDRLTITKPRISYTPTQQNAPVNSSNVAFPVQLPLGINSIQVIDGTLELQHQAGRILLHDIEINTALQQQANFSLAGYLGDGRKQPITLAGEYQLSQESTLTLTELQWKNSDLLTAPLVVRPGALQAGGSGRFNLASLDKTQLLALLQALKISVDLPETLDFSLRDISLALELAGDRPKVDILVAEGTLAYQNQRLPLRNIIILLLQEQQSWKIDGQLIGPADLQISYTTRLQGKTLLGRVGLDIPDLDTLSRVLALKLPIPLLGGVELQGDYFWSGQQLSAELVLQGVGATEASADQINVAALSGDLRLQTSADKFSYQFNLNSSRQLLLSGYGNQAGHRLTLEELDLDRLTAVFPASLLPKEFNQLEALSGTSDFQLDSRQHLSGDFKLSAADIALAELSPREIRLNGKLRSTPEGLQFPELIFSSRFAHQENVTGQISATLSGLLSDKGYMSRIDSLNLADIEYLADDGNAGVSGGGLKLKGAITGRFSGSPQLDISGELRGKELLAGAFYADLSRYHGRFSLLGEINLKERSLTLQKLQFHIPEVIQASASGKLALDTITLQGEVQLKDLAQSYGRHAAPLLQDLAPGLDKLTLAGQLAAAYQLLWKPGGWALAGIIEPKGVDAFWDVHALEIADGHGKLPFNITRGLFLPDAPSVEQTGTLTFHSLAVGLAKLETSQLDLLASENQLRLQSRLSLGLAGGNVAIEELLLRWPEAGPEGEAEINIKQVDLARLTKQLNLPQMQGRFQADLGKISYRNKQLSTDGLARLSVFGGNFLVRNMRYVEPFSSYPVFHADIDFSGLDLLQATTTLDFGEMNGILDGYIHGLKLFGKTPAAFTADISTRTRGKRNISVKALNNLSILSQGGISAALSRGIYRFIDFYRYQKIGFKCALENDTFILTGTARADTEKYLVYGGLLPPRIDITTTSPTISFKEMMKRIGRIDRAGR